MVKQGCYISSLLVRLHYCPLGDYRKVRDCMNTRLPVCPSGGTAYTLVLGTSRPKGLGGSNPSLGTKVMKGKIWLMWIEKGRKNINVNG